MSHASHVSPGSLTDLWMSREFPDPTIYPETIAYRDQSGRAEMPRMVKIQGGQRSRVLVVAGLKWTGERTGDPMDEADRQRIISRIRSVYDEWGYPYELR